MSDKQPGVPVKDDPAVMEIYASKIVSSTFDGHAFSITLGNGRIVPERTDEQPKEGLAICVNGRITLSPPAAIELINSLSQMLTAVQKGQRPAAAA